MAGASHYILDRPEFEDPIKLLIIVAPYYKDITDGLVAGAKAEIEAAGGTYEVIEVPGALEIPTAIGIAARMSNFDSSRAITLLGLQGHCIGNGILTVENYKQAAVRSDPKDQNKGGGAAAAALHLIALGRKWGRAGKIGFTNDILLAQKA